MNESENIIANVSDTALWVAVYRANESERPDSAFQDPLARLLVGERGPAIARKIPYAKGTAWTMVMRTSVLDRFVLQLVREGVDCVLNLGAGLDTRPYRLKLPENLRWIEVDFPHMIDYKSNILKNEKPVCHLERVALNLGDLEARRRFFDSVNVANAKIAVITEGVIPYLTMPQAQELAEDLTARKNFQFWIQDHYTLQSLRFMYKMRKHMQNAPIIFDAPDWMGFFTQAGWRPRDTVALGDESVRLRRPFPVPWPLGWVLKIVPGAAAKLRAASGCSIFIRAN